MSPSGVPGKQGMPTKIIYKQAVLKSHPTVLELIEEGFDPDMSIEAVKRFGEDDIAVRDYLHSMEEKGDIFNTSDMQYTDEEKESTQTVELITYVFTSKKRYKDRKKTGTRGILSSPIPVMLYQRPHHLKAYQPECFKSLCIALE